ncbi:MAG: hypothetical protein MJ241_00450 [Bacilli bacterium]|nr:hypothetical protein [Bacilli bacterium]
MAKTRKQKAILAGKILGGIFGTIAVFLLVCNIIPPTKVTKDNPFIVAKGEQPMIAAHRGGGISNPENTMKAYKAAVSEFKVDIIETDLWMTKDKKLVYNHDASINRMSDVEYWTESKDKYLIGEHTLDELKRFNLGYNFVDPDTKERTYENYVSDYELDDPTRLDILKDNDLQIVEIQELFAQFYTTNPDLKFIVEIKNGGEDGKEAANIIDKVLTDQFPNYKKNIVIGTFHPEIEKDLKDNHPSLMRGASTGGAAKFLITQMLGVNIFSNVDFTCLQIPLKMYGLDLTWNTYIRRAHRRNIAVQYWTINEVDDMKFLIKKGVDAIMTDDPKLLRTVLESK